MRETASPHFTAQLTNVRMNEEPLYTDSVIPSMDIKLYLPDAPPTQFSTTTAIEEFLEYDASNHFVHFKLSGLDTDTHNHDVYRLCTMLLTVRDMMINALTGKGSL